MKLLPDEADFFLSYCTKPGPDPAKRGEKASLYVQKLTKLLKKYAST